MKFAHGEVKNECIYPRAGQINPKEAKIFKGDFRIVAVKVRIRFRTYNDNLPRQSNTWANAVQSEHWAETFSYDNNGNITGVIRNGATDSALNMDYLRYQYTYNSHGLANNRLDHITDTVSENNYGIDVDNQQQNNYLYDMNGNLLHDQANGIDSIVWNAYGKVSRVVSSDPKRYNIDFMYDAMGNRIVKKLTSADDPGDLTKLLYEYYLRDAQGNIMGIYTSRYNSDLERWELRLSEHHLYGSSRLGIDKSDTLVSFTSVELVDDPAALYSVQEQLNNIVFNLQVVIANSCQGDPDSKKILYCDLKNTFPAVGDWCKDNEYQYQYSDGDMWVTPPGLATVSVMEAIQNIPGFTVYINHKSSGRSLGHKQYEITNHLGNVISTVSDRKFGMDTATSGSVQYYAPQILSATDYYAFGAPMPGRYEAVSDTGYRFGFNGKEKVDEITGTEGTDYDFGARMYDARVGRWWSSDFFKNKFPSNSPYCSMENNPLSFVDIGGDSTIYYSENGDYIWTSWDTKRDAICVISNKNLPYFMLYLRCVRALGKNRDKNEVNTFLRRFGDCYAVRDFEKFFEETKGKFRNKVNPKYGNEVLSYLYLNNGMITVGKERIVGEPGIVSSLNDLDPATGSILPQEPENIGEIHTHVNSGMTEFLKGIGTYADEPTSGVDYKFDGNRFWDVVVSPENLYLTRKKPDNMAAEQLIKAERKKMFARGAGE